MRVVRALDAGPMLATSGVPIGADETSADVERDLATLGAAAAGRTSSSGCRRARCPRSRSRDAGVTYADRITKDDGADRLVAAGARDSQPGPRAAPLAACLDHDRRAPAADREDAPNRRRAGTGRQRCPARVLEAEAASSLVVAAGHGTLRILDAAARRQARTMTAREFLAGHHARRRRRAWNDRARAPRGATTR